MACCHRNEPEASVGMASYAIVNRSGHRAGYPMGEPPVCVRTAPVVDYAAPVSVRAVLARVGGLRLAACIALLEPARGPLSSFSTADRPSRPSRRYAGAGGQAVVTSNGE